MTDWITEIEERAGKVDSELWDAIGRVSAGTASRLLQPVRTDIPKLCKGLRVAVEALRQIRGDVECPGIPGTHQPSIVWQKANDALQALQQLRTTTR